VKRLKAKIRRVYNKRKLGERYQVELKRLAQEFLAAQKKKLQRNIFVLSTMKLNFAGPSSTSM